MKNFKNMKSRLGFTLLEMLIVIGIIGVLVGLGTASYSTAQRKSRDARRKGDIKIIQNSLEQYYSICGYAYPTAASSYSSVICLSPSTAILNPAPNDPKTTTPYPCTGCTGSSYSICASTESEPTPCVSSQQ